MLIQIIIHLHSKEPIDGNLSTVGSNYLIPGLPDAVESPEPCPERLPRAKRGEARDQLRADTGRIRGSVFQPTGLKPRATNCPRTNREGSRPVETGLQTNPAIELFSDSFSFALREAHNKNLSSVGANGLKPGLPGAVESPELCPERLPRAKRGEARDQLRADTGRTRSPAIVYIIPSLYVSPKDWRDAPFDFRYRKYTPKGWSRPRRRHHIPPAN